MHIVKDMEINNLFFKKLMMPDCKKVSQHYKNTHMWYVNLHIVTRQTHWMSTWINQKELQVKSSTTYDMVLWSFYADKFLHKPTFNYIHILYVAHESKHGFPVMLGSIDCIHANWRNYPIAMRA